MPRTNSVQPGGLRDIACHLASQCFRNDQAPPTISEYLRIECNLEESRSGTLTQHRRLDCRVSADCVLDSTRGTILSVMLATLVSLKRGPATLTSLLRFVSHFATWDAIAEVKKAHERESHHEGRCRAAAVDNIWYLNYNDELQQHERHS